MSAPKEIRRIIVCVDGTWYNADGKESNGHGNTSNVFRIFASVKQGKFTQDSIKYEQIVQYFHGIGVKKWYPEKLIDGVSGLGCEELIKEVYQYCCANIRSPADELWFFGFSRGAYVVRAVASMFRYMATAVINKDPKDFDATYKEALSYMSFISKDKVYRHGGEMYRFLAEKTQESPAIEFLGLFDTVKYAKEPVKFDISFESKCFKRVRHALSLNEDRPQFVPEIYQTSPDETLPDNSLVQAWFLGSHADIGGGHEHDGLSLYPLQWMLLESRKHGLILEHKPQKRFEQLIDDPLKLVLPRTIPSAAGGEEVAQEANEIQPWRYRYSNGIEVDMYDLRLSHNHGNLQKWSRRRLKKRSVATRASHGVIVNRGARTTLFRAQIRDIFSNGLVNQYNCADSGRYGTIIHPSTYFLLETYPRLGNPSIRDSVKPFFWELESFRQNLQCVGSKMDPWLAERHFNTNFPNFRILICGNAGVGKSTLLNKVFGSQLSQENHNQHGKHDIDQPFETDKHPGLILHDSEGFQAGDTKEVVAFEKFLKKRLMAPDVEDQLHAIWICVESYTERPIHTAEEKILSYIEDLAPDMPVIIVGTKTDKFLKFENIADDPKTQQDTLTAQIESFRRIYEEKVKEVQLKFVFVSQDDKASIRTLLHMTMGSVIDDRVYGALVSAQVADLDLKIDLSIDQTVRLLRTEMKSLIFPTVIGPPTLSKVICETILRCYGLTKAEANQVDAIMEEIVWPNMVKYMAQHITQNLAIWTLATGLGAATGLGFGLVAVLPFLEAPAVARVIVKGACDLIIVLDQAFRWGGKDLSPDLVRRAATEYRRESVVGMSVSTRSRVHHDINSMFPIMSKLITRVYRPGYITKITEGMKKIVESNRMRLDTGKDLDVESLSDALSSTTLAELSGDEEELKQLESIGSAETLKNSMN